MARQRLPEESKDEQCDICGATKPYHLTDCYHILGRICPECGASFPRHYGGPNHYCSQDVLHFTRWWIPKSQQEDVLTLHNAMEEEARTRGINTVPPSLPEFPRFPNEHIVNPIYGRRIIKAIVFLAFSNSPEIMRERKQAILEQINEYQRNN